MSKLYDLAVRFYNNNELEKAAILAKNLIYSQTLDAKNFKLMGAVNQAQGQFSFAIGAYQHAFKLDCKDASIAFTIAQCYVQLGRYESAKRWLDCALAIAPGDIRINELAKAVKQKLT